jgi:hypothetical protein
MLFSSRRRPVLVSQPFRPALEILEDRCLLTIFAVTNINDSGPGSFRQALLDNNNNPGQTNAIDFHISGIGEHSLRPRSAFPQITNPVIIDGTTQADYLGAPVVVLVGTYADNGEVHGLDIAAGYSTVKGLVINGFTGAGILMENEGYNVVQNCYIGTDITGTIAFFNNKGGVLTALGSDHNLIGGTDPQDRNVISGNNGNGIDFFSSFNVAEGNYLGLTANGKQALPNSKLGVLIGNINGETQGNVVGGTAPGAGNVISGNAEAGVEVDVGSHDNVIQGNWIGPDAKGTRARGNRVEGIVIKGGVNTLIGGTEPGAGNVISGNVDGILIETDNNQVQGNLIGLDPAGTQPMPNKDVGIIVVGSNNLIGGTDPGAGNVIADSGSDGVYVPLASGNAIQQNSIFGNGRLGIDLGLYGNEDEPAPSLNSATTDGESTTITGALASVPDMTFTIEFYGNPDYDGTGFAQGEQFLGSLAVTTDDMGAADFSVTLDGVADPGLVITATATDAANNTSQFSDYVVVSSAVALNRPSSVGTMVSPAPVPATLASPTFEPAAVDSSFAAPAQSTPILALLRRPANTETGANEMIGQVLLPLF